MRLRNISAACLVSITALATGCAADRPRNVSQDHATTVGLSGSLAVQTDTYLEPLAAELRKTWPNNRTVNIVCHGHSVPSGYFRTPDVRTMDSYPHLMHVGISERYPNAVTNVITTSIGGENAIAGARRFESDVLNHKPDLITIDYSLNDRRAGVEAAQAAWREMIELAIANEIPVILLTPTPDQRADLNAPNDPLNQHAEMVRGLATEYDIGLVDSLAYFKQHIEDGGELTDLMSQVNHPNRAGHELVAAGLMEWFPE